MAWNEAGGTVCAHIARRCCRGRGFAAAGGVSSSARLGPTAALPCQSLSHVRAVVGVWQPVRPILHTGPGQCADQ